MVAAFFKDKIPDMNVLLYNAVDSSLRFLHPPLRGFPVDTDIQILTGKVIAIYSAKKICFYDSHSGIIQIISLILPNNNSSMLQKLLSYLSSSEAQYNLG